MLTDRLNAALASSSGTAQNFYLTRLLDALNAVEQAAASSQQLREYAKQLGILLSQTNFELDPHLSNKFAQALGEAHFSLLCSNAGVPLRRIPEVQNLKTPDFEVDALPGKLHFEVKTLSVVGGEAGIGKAISDSVTANLELEAKVRSGQQIAIAESEVAPYGEKVRFETQILDTTHVLIEKARQNIKADQFANPNTFLVLNLSMLHLPGGELGLLRPSYPDDRLFPTCITGALWTMAFGKPGMLIQSEPEFEGKPCVEGELDKLGILKDPEFAAVRGILFVVHPLSKPPQILALFRNFDEISDDNGDVVEQVLKIVGKGWNDGVDTNGWQLR
ncbi:hypothetical protein N234_18230 [Ralstonia pickettii DTP0602]|nr:hypothetical protein N234_18230 [Ralstonia pickettii DTP0602]